MISQSSEMKNKSSIMLVREEEEEEEELFIIFCAPRNHRMIYIQGDGEMEKEKSCIFLR